MPPKKREVVVLHREAEEHHAHHGGSWKVAYADFVTAMMALFLLLWLLMALKPQQKTQLSLYFRSPDVAIKESRDGAPMLGEVATSNEIVQKLGQPQKVQLAVAGKIKDLIRSDPKLSDGSGVQVDEKGVLLQIPSGVIFNPASTTLTAEAMRVLDGVADILKENPVNIQIRGYADESETQASAFPNKWVFSAARAASALRYIAQKFKLPPVRIEAVGFGDSRPMASADTDEGKNRNRRIEIYYSLIEHEGK